MLQIDKFLSSEMQRSDVIFIDKFGVGSDIIYLPESGDLTNFINTQKLNIPSKIENVIVPPRLVIGNKPIINNVYYMNIKKLLPNLLFFKVPPKLKTNNKIRIYDLSPTVKDLVNISNTKTIINVYREYFEKVFTSVQDFSATTIEKERKKILLIDIDLNQIKTGFTLNFEYYISLSGYRINHLPYYPDAIIYRIDNMYYPIAKLVKDSKDSKLDYMAINKIQLQKVIGMITELETKTIKEINQTKPLDTVPLLGFKSQKNIDTILNTTKDLEDLVKITDPVKRVNKLKDYLNSNPVLEDLNGSDTTEKLNNLQLAIKHAEKIRAKNTLSDALNGNTKELEEKETDKLKEDQEKEKQTNEFKDIDSIEQKLIKEYNGTKFLSDMQERSNFGIRSFNPDNIVGLKEFSGYNKQAKEFSSNLDASIEDLIMSLVKDQDIKINVHKITSDIKDDNKTRYKEYVAQISHPDFGDTYKNKYPIKFKVPYPVEEKYMKIGGNDYIMVNQLFNKPIQKVNSHLARLYTHYNTTSVSLKNSKFNNKLGLPEIEKEFNANLKNMANNPKTKSKYITELINDDDRKILLNKGLPLKLVAKFKFKKLYYSDTETEFIFDLSKDSFYSYSKGGSKIEFAKFNIQNKEIDYDTEGDLRNFPIEHTDEFILGIYNKLSKILIGIDIIKKSKSSVPFFEARIVGKNIPVIVLLIAMTSWSETMRRLDLKWSIQSKKIVTKDIGIGGDPINIACLDTKKQLTYLTVYPKSLKQRCLALGLTRFKIKDSIFMGESSNDLYDRALANEFGEVGYFKFKETIPKIIDNTTEKILKEYNYPIDVLTLYSETIPNLLLSREDSHFENLDHYRIRMSETISHIGYNQIQRAISELKRKKNFPGEKLFIKPEFIMSSLLEAGIFQNAKTINPIEEMMLSQKIIKTGIGNVKKSQVTLQRRDLNPSYFGVISPTATNEYGGIGSNQTLTNGTTITDRFGSIKTKKYTNTDNPFNMLSPVESLTPFFEYDDTTRRIMGNQQTGQFTQLDSPDEPAVQTGFEQYVPFLVSDRFTKKAKITGKVQIEDDTIVINGTGIDQGKIQKISIRHAKSRTKRGVYLLNKYTPVVNDQQNVKAGTILAATSSLKTGKLAVGKNLVVAEFGYNGMNYEDGWVIIDDIKTKYKNSYLQKMLILVPNDVKIQTINMAKNQMTEAGELLFSFIKKDYFHNGIEDENEEDDTLYGLEQHNGNSKYYSPGGRIAEIVVRLNSNNVDPKLKTLYNQSIKDLTNLKKSCELLSSKIEDKKEREQNYMDCMGNTDNIASLQVGGHKIGGEEPGWAIIEVFVERNNPIGNGSKFTLGNSGGKGTVQYIIPKGMEPISEDTKLKIDFIPTSLSIIKRKNPSIYFNMYLGKCMYFLNEQIKNKPFNEVKEKVLTAYKLIDKTKDGKIVKEIETFFNNNNEDSLRKALNQSNISKVLFPAIVPPFMNKITMRDIVQLSRFLDIPLKERIMIPENDGTFTLKKVPVGILNVFLLEHFPQTQGSVRGSQYVKNSIVTGQGSSGTKDRKGATKTGLYDLYSILTKTPYHLIKELHSLKSDAKSAKFFYQRQIFANNSLPTIADIKITKDDTTTKNYIEALLLGACLKPYY